MLKFKLDAPLADGDQVEVVRQEYRLTVPNTWQAASKAGADVLYKVPDIKYTDLGVTVAPVRISTLQQLGDVDAVGKRLIATERQKVCN